MTDSHKNLVEIHENVPADHYDKGIKRNLFQKFWHRRRFSEVLKIIQPINGTVLDIGCHAGTFTEQLLNKLQTRKIYGIDISPSALKLAQKRIPYGNFQIADAANLPFKNNFFDAIFCLEVLEHVDNPLKVISEIKRILKKGGWGIILVPSESKLFKTVWFLWTLYYPIWSHAHVQSFDGRKLENFLKDFDLKIKLTKTFNLGMLKLVMFEK